MAARSRVGNSHPVNQGKTDEKVSPVKPVIKITNKIGLKNLLKTGEALVKLFCPGPIRLTVGSVNSSKSPH